MNKHCRYFVTGTDTGVGKTFVTAGIARAETAAGKRVFAYKPIETGTSQPKGEDQAALVRAAGSWQTGDLAGPYQFLLPAAPLVASEAEHRVIDLARIKHIYELGAKTADVVLVEGAGGLRVPVTKTLDMAGLAALLELPLLVVARATLGTVNHSLLTIEAAERVGLQVRALILSRRPADDLAFASCNAATIRRAWPGNVVVYDGTGSLSDLVG